MIELHSFQTDLVNRTIAAIRSGNKRILLVLPTGGGKTVVASRIVTGAIDKKNSCMFLVHRIELAEQAIKTFGRCDIQCGVIAAEHKPDTTLLTQVAMVGTLAGRLAQYKPPAIIIIDEAHHAVAATWRKVLEAYPDALVIGLTATPERLDGRGLGDIFQTMIVGPEPLWLIQNGYLSPFRAFSPKSGVGEEGLEVRGGDFSVELVEEKMDKPTVTGDAIKEYIKIAPGQRALVFCASIKHSKNVAAQFTGSGYPAEHIDGTTPKDERRAIMDRFRAWQTIIMCNVDLFAEGVDVPDASVVILLAHTMSLGKHLQRCGRALRVADGKDTAFLIDHVGAFMRHGLPSDKQEWSLEGKKRSKKNLEHVKHLMQCPECDGWFPPARVCPGCGYVVPVKERLRYLKHVPGELVELYIEEMRRDAVTEEEKVAVAECTMADEEKKRAIWQLKKNAKTFEQLKLLEKSAGYKAGWADHVWNARIRKDGFKK